jgi:hypothetical protein
MRINARLDKEMARKFKRLLELTKQGKTEVVKRAIDSYFREIAAGAAPPRTAELLKECGFVGCGAAGRNLSESYKSILTRSLGRKA